MSISKQNYLENRGRLAELKHEDIKYEYDKELQKKIDETLMTAKQQAKGLIKAEKIGSQAQAAAFGRGKTLRAPANHGSTFARA